MNKHYTALELDKILAMLAAETTCAEASALALSLTPVTDEREANRLLAQTEDAFQLLARFGAPSFSGLKNVRHPVKRAAAGGLLNTRELLEIAGTLRCIRSLSEWRSHSAGTASGLDFFFEGLLPNKYLETRIHDVILSEEEISDKASDALFQIRRKIKSASVRVREQLDKMIRSPHYKTALQEPIVTQRNGRFVVPVKNECRGEVPGLVHDSSSSGATVFVEPIAVVEANNEIRILQNKEREEIERILYELSAEAGGFADSISSSFDHAVNLNLIFAKAHLAYKMKASKPELNSEGIIDLKNARHPLLDQKKVVPTHIILGGAFDTLVITGPNTGGKTVTIKTIGLFTLMVMCGLLIPVSDQSRISVFEKVLVDLGDEQSIEQNLSTFSAHMTNIISIMKTADGRSLVLIDELGAGTDPIEGAALATAILDDLRRKGAKIGATTHYAELKAYALQTDGVVNGCCEFDVKSLRPTYRLLIGVPGRSNAFAISQRLGMDPEVVNRAGRLVSEDDRSFEQVVAQLEESRQSLEGERGEARRLMAEARGVSNQAKEEKAALEKQKERELEQARGEAKRIIDTARRQSEELTRELDRIRKETASMTSADMARRAKSDIKAKLNRFDELIHPVTEEEIEDEDYVLPRPLQIGDIVFVKSLGSEGEVMALPDKNGNVEIASGAIKTRVPSNLLRLTNKKREKSKTKAVRTSGYTASRANVSVAQSCDLRGKTVEEALLDLDLYIDHALMSGLGEVTVIHGKGTGALRKAVQEHLRHHKSIKTYRLGVFGEGENGVTIVTLK